MFLKLFFIGLSLIIFYLNEIKSLKEEEYIQSIDNLLLNKNFIKEYTKWSFQLFSDRDYLYGKQFGDFPCEIPSKEESINIPLTVHTLRPTDIQCVGAIGDSLTAALGAHAATPIGLFTENRGVSWSVGGDHSFEQLLTMPNILREYNPNLIGYSTRSSLINGKGQNSSHNALNVAESGDRSYHMVDQAHILYERILSKKYCDINNDWKVITFFIGGNDLCIFCQDRGKHSPANFTQYVQDTLDFFHQNFARTFINLALVLDVRNVQKLNAGGVVCTLLHANTCPCAAFPTQENLKTLDEWIPLYHSNLLNLINSGRYDTRDDFTVVIQPFFAHTGLPMTTDGQIDYSYFAPDCFHLSGKGHSRAALSLWNNMLEPVGQKQWEWHEGEQIECPTEERPYFATRKNSPTPFEKIPF